EYSLSITREDLLKLVDFVKLAGASSKVSDYLKDLKIDPSSLLPIIDSLSSRGMKDVEIDLSIVRGIDYYTDMVFEAFDKDNPRLGALCGGGRYDSLPAVYGRPDFGATGVAGGVERAMLAYRFSRSASEKIFVASVGHDPKIRNIGTALAAELRASGYSAQSDISGRSLRKILETQSTAGARAVIIVGEREVATNTVKVKWMSSGEEMTVSTADLKRTLSSEK
ncbi:MAG: His/Gly/Thr/Pro-type tRNA ligase C-terminal domain-containing protein, partial [Rhabdochlamydiaceae bacterium]